ncbi:hemolysin family protein [Microbacterium stercoris]|uniref:HlyC/CorC family transporter n=1 Tax=Microbacterium stercoris TaxID=2820289 RepID=A0A939TRH6_9MICO|nr:hemolysin family protein [Microbacterium stercoris]MBO3664156.1 HlyC/CorC family transporter [Microbacterium stercoris]
MAPVLLLCGALVLVLFAGLMSAVDAALGVSSRGDLVELATEGRSTRSLARIAADPDRHGAVVVFVRVLAEMTAAVLVTAAFTVLFANVWWAIVCAALVMAGVDYVAVASSPATYGRRYAEKLLPFAAPVVRGLCLVLGPVAYGLARFGRRLTPGGGRRSFESEEQLLSIVDEAVSNAVIEADDRELIHSVFDFTDQVVRAVMVPRTEMVTVDADASMSEALRLFLDRGISRMPVVDGEVDDIIGVLYLKDVVQFRFREGVTEPNVGIRVIARPAVFVPEQMRAETLLQQMKRDAVHVCLVVDEYGGIAGLVTLEDLIEELVGEIADEYDTPSKEIVELTDGRYRVSARLSLDEVGELFGVELEDDDVDSIGGLLGKTLGRVPQPGDVAEASGIVLTGGTSRGRGRGIATVFVERSDALLAVEEAFAEFQPRTGEIPVTKDPDVRRAPAKKRPRDPRSGATGKSTKEKEER